MGALIFLGGSQPSGRAEAADHFLLCAVLAST